MPEGGNTIVVKVNNLCPADGNPLCAAPVGEFESFARVSRGGFKCCVGFACLV